jgi:UDP:flavonoid glycosyltransferase YjiC (YdhE family)
MRQGVKTYNTVLASEGLPPVAVGDFLELTRKCATDYFQSGVPGFDYPRRNLPTNVKFVGPLLPNRKATVLPVELADKLREDRSVIVVSQGTVDNTDADKLFVPALEALKGASHLVIATTGGKNTEELRKRFPETNVVIEDFIDFDLLFEHADLFICNGGYGSILLALSHGVPILSAGTREGKNDINSRIDYSGFGVDLKTERPKPERIAKGVTRVLGDTHFAQNVERIRAEFRSYHPLDLIDGYITAGDAASLSELPLDYDGVDNRASESGSTGATAATKRKPAN